MYSIRFFDAKGTPQTAREHAKDRLVEMGKKIDKHPAAAIALMCGTAHIAGYTLLHFATKPPKSAPSDNQSTKTT